MKIGFVCAAFMLLTPFIFAKTTANVDKNGVILSGYDAVSYFSPNGPIKGKPEFQVRQDGVVYYFANAKNKETFSLTPQKFEPQFGGWCAYAIADSSSKVEIDPKSFTIQDGRLLVFYNGFLSDTRDKWLNSKSITAQKYLQEADAHWVEVKIKDP